MFMAIFIILDLIKNDIFIDRLYPKYPLILTFLSSTCITFEALPLYLLLFVEIHHLLKFVRLLYPHLYKYILVTYITIMYFSMCCWIHFKLLQFIRLLCSIIITYRMVEQIIYFIFNIVFVIRRYGGLLIYLFSEGMIS